MGAPERDSIRSTHYCRLVPESATVHVRPQVQMREVWCWTVGAPLLSDDHRAKNDALAGVRLWIECPTPEELEDAVFNGAPNFHFWPVTALS